MTYQWSAGNDEKAGMIDLREEVAQVANRELRESKSIREQSLQQFREWTRKNQDICSCRTGNHSTDKADMADQLIVERRKLHIKNFLIFINCQVLTTGA
jgi:hypothetical protein